MDTIWDNSTYNYCYIHHKIYNSMIDIAIVSGAGSGIGKEIALELARRGVKVICISKNNALKTAEEIWDSGGFAEGINIDIRKYWLIDTDIQTILKDEHDINIGLVLCAGQLGNKFDIENMCLMEWEEVMNVNLLGNLAIVKGAMNKMLESKFGRIVFFAGGGSVYPYPIFSAYSASKTAIVRTVENLHECLKDRGNFGVCSLAPGAVDTNMLKKVREVGAEIKTLTDVKESVDFVTAFMDAEDIGFSGRMVHVRDDWKRYLDNENIAHTDMWKLIRQL